jgi:hypothetical protein
MVFSFFFTNTKEAEGYGENITNIFEPNTLFKKRGGGDSLAFLFIAFAGPSLREPINVFEKKNCVFCANLGSQTLSEWTYCK